MKAVMISIRPEWCEKIASGKKTVEVRKTKPHLEPPFKCYMYCTNKGKSLWYYDDRFDTQEKMNGKVIGEFMCDFFDDFAPTDKGVIIKRFSSLHDTALSLQEISGYLNGKQGFGWHISDLIIYDTTKSLTEFLKPCITPEMPYCPECTSGGEYVSDTEAEFYRTDGECNTEWRCLNYLRRPPQSWCYIMEV